MSAAPNDPITDVDIRAYFASVIGAVRAPYGRRGGKPLVAGDSFVLAKNGTANRVLSVTVSRSDFAGAAANVIFTQNNEGAASPNDFPVTFTATTVQRFIVRPGEIVSITVVAGSAPLSIVVGQETY